MKKRPRNSREQPPSTAKHPRELTARELATAVGGTGGGNKVWQDDWLAPV